MNPPTVEGYTKLNSMAWVGKGILGWASITRPTMISTVVEYTWNYLYYADLVVSPCLVM